MAGPGADWVSHIRGGKTRFDEKTIEAAVDASLKRLKTDYIDLYQLHWPERNTNYFGRLGYQQAADEQKLTPLIDTLRGLKKQVQAGKIRHIGLSNETPWGMMQFITLAKAMDLPLVVSVQNPYSLLNRTYEIGCAEISHRENVGLLAYSPLGFGVLTGKYLDQQPENARLTRWPNYSRYSNPQAIEATRRYVELARRFQLDPAQMALAFVNSRPFLTANIIGATSMEQLRNNIASENLILTEEILSEIELIHQSIPNPAP